MSVGNHTCSHCVTELWTRYIILFMLHHCIDLSGELIRVSSVKISRTGACWGTAVHKQICLSECLPQAAPSCSCSPGCCFAFDCTVRGRKCTTALTLPLTSSKGSSFSLEVPSTKDASSLSHGKETAGYIILPYSFKVALLALTVCISHFAYVCSKGTSEASSSRLSA